MNRMKIADLFYSIQGEGILAGVPSAFVRTTGCNLRCSFCDTPYTSWAPEGETFTVAQILDRLAAYPTRHVVLTGGEPLLMPDVEELCRSLRARLSRHGRDGRHGVQAAGLRPGEPQSQAGELDAAPARRRPLRPVPRPPPDASGPSCIISPPLTTHNHRRPTASTRTKHGIDQVSPTVHLACSMLRCTCPKLVCAIYESSIG